MNNSPSLRAALKVFLPAVCLGVWTSAGFAQSKPGMELHWLEGKAPALSNGATWGVPWPRGTVARDAQFGLKTKAGEAVPVQSWPLAYWPDGSLKWSAHAIGANAGLAEGLVLAPGAAAAPSPAVAVTEDAKTIRIDTGVAQFQVAKGGDALITEIAREGKTIARNGRLVCLLQDGPEDAPERPVHVEAFAGRISAVTLEQRGPVRAVVKIEGQHANAAGRAWLPFVVRLYFYAGGESVRVVHTFIFDGDAEKDFIRGLGLRFDVPMRGELYDRHVRFVGQDGGLFGEAVRGITGLRRDPGAAARNAQVAGEAAPPTNAWTGVAGGLDHIPAFGDYTLFQPTADSFEIRKRTKEGYSWLNSAYGRRSAGVGYVGTPAGGLAFGIRNFWQSHPAQLDIRGAASDEAQVTLWLWSPEARAMDLRFYHDGLGQDTFAKQLDGMNITYEDYEPGFGTPQGVARTSEMMLWALPATPPRARIVALADSLQAPPMVVANPASYKAAEVFGGAIWGLPDRSTPSKKAIEDQLDFYFATYQREIEQRHWYGFWNFGDVMHTYDSDRHTWRYDVGGFAWDNSELSTDLWLWYAYLRSGRADIFRVAEAMTRHTGEVDVYHLGRFQGLGTRHGVLHWGDSSKQLRISTATNRRFYYFLTADERVGDLLRELLDADRRVGDLLPTRKLVGEKPPKLSKEYPVQLSVGTDWGSISGAWLTEWERTGDLKYRDKLVNGMKGIAGLTHGWFSGGGAYDPETGKFQPNSDGFSVSHLSSVFGAFEVNAELLQLLDVPEYAKTWLQYCELYNAPAAEQKRVLGQDLGKLNLGQGHSRLTAYAAWKRQDPKLAARAWAEFFGHSAGPAVMRAPFPVKHLTGPDVLNPIDETPVSTNATAQFGLAAIQCLALVGDYIPTVVPEEKAPRRPASAR